MRALSLLPVALLLTLLNSPAFAAEASWRFGVARTKITPTTPVWMSGYASRTKPAEGTLNDLWCKALVLQDDAGRRVCLITLDLCGIDRDTSLAIRDELKTKLGLDRESVAIVISHTHSGPMIGRNLRVMLPEGDDQAKKIAAYTDWLREQVVATAARAASNLVPANVRYGVGTAKFAVNRRENKEPEVAAAAAADWSPGAAWREKLKGPVDHDLPVLEISADGKPAVVLFGYACHATTLAGYDWSSDWPGFAAEAIEAAHPGATAMFVTGCGADQNPIPRRTVDLAKTWGRQCADGVEAALKADLKPIAGRITPLYAEIDLPFGAQPTRAALEQQKASKDAKDRYTARRAALLLERLDRDGRLPEHYPYPVQRWQLGNGPAMILLGGEVVVDYSLRLKKELGPNVWPVGYANDVMAYIPSKRVLDEGGYEGASSMIYYGQPTVWDAAAEEKIVAEAKRQAGAKP